MATKSTPALNAAPAPIPTILTAFELVSRRLYLILFPVALDLILWFGPHLRITNLLQPMLRDLDKSLALSMPADLREVMMQSWQIGAERYNLLGGLRAFPVGIPSLMMAQAPLETPLGAARLIETPSLGAALSVWLLCALVGITLGSLFFNLLARMTTKSAPWNINHLLWQTLQSILFVVLSVALATMIAIPGALVSSIVTLFSPALGMLAMLVILFSAIWLLLPLAFAPFGIFLFDLNAIQASILSYRLVRAYLPGVALFFLSSLVISQGLDILWRIPPERSWMTLVGILGHAFISTALIQACFVYYSAIVLWTRQQIQPPPGVAV